MDNDKTAGKVKTRRLRTAERKGSLELHNGKWRIVALVNGQKIRKSTGTANREEAERIQKEFMAQFTARDAVAQQEKLADAVKTAEAKAEAAAKRAEEALPALRLSDAWETYANDFTRKTTRPTAAVTDRVAGQCFARFVKWVEEHFPDCVEMRQVNEDIAKEYLEKLRNRVSPSTYRLNLAYIKRVWNVIGEEAKCRTNPWTKIKLTKCKGLRRENFIPEQIDAIFAKLKPGSELHALCTIGLYTGLRLGDAATLKWSAVDLRSGFIELVPSKVKRCGKSVRIPIHETLRSVLTALPRQGEYVIPVMAQRYKQQSISSAITRLLRSAGLETSQKVEGYAHPVPRYGFHSFRHSFVSTCGEQGIPLSVVQELVGHLSPDMTQHYFHLGDDAARKAIAMLPGAGATSPTGTGDAAKVEAAVEALSGLTKEELRAVREKLDALLAK